MNVKNRLRYWLLDKLTNNDTVVIINAHLNVDENLNFGNEAFIKDSMFVGFGRKTLKREGEAD